MSFRVPESARVQDHPIMGSDFTAGRNGAFRLRSPEPGRDLWIIASDGMEPEAAEWEHVSVHAVQGNKSRTPTWREMCFVKDAFWDAEDVVMQLHPRRSEYVNEHPNVLHLWRSRRVPIPEPPYALVGRKL